MLSGVEKPMGPYGFPSNGKGGTALWPIALTILCTSASLIPGLYAYAKVWQAVLPGVQRCKGGIPVVGISLVEENILCSR